MTQISKNSEKDKKLAGIAGWLILPALGLIVGPIIGIVGLFMTLSVFKDISAAGFGGIVGFESLVAAGLLAYAIYAAVKFFGRKTEAPSIMIGLLTASLVSSVVILFVEFSAGAPEFFIIETVKQLFRDAIAAAIWIPYFRVSKRVEATFIY